MYCVSCEVRTEFISHRSVSSQNRPATQTVTKFGFDSVRASRGARCISFLCPVALTTRPQKHIRVYKNSVRASRKARCISVAGCSGHWIIEPRSSQSQSHVTTDGQCVGFTLELVTRYYFLSESCCVVSVGRPLLREVGSVSCQSLSSVFSPLSKI
jgi:hypothetical protein